MRLRYPALMLAVLVLVAGSAQAVPLLSIEPDPGIPGFIPVGIGVTNDLLVPIYGSGTTSRAGYYAASITLTEPSTLYFTYLGKEAGYLNEFWVGGVKIFNTGTTPIGTTVALPMAGGVVPFYFFVATTGDTAANCAVGPECNPDNSGVDANFFTSFDANPAAQIGESLVLFLDDSGAANDDNHDDMAVRISTVPEPGSMLLVGSGLAALWARRRRRV